MKLNSTKYLVLTFLMLFQLSCKKENMGDCFKSTGKIVRESRPISSFTAIELEDRVNLYLRFTETLSLEVEAGENLQELIKTENKGGTLFIKNENKCNWVRSYKKEVNVFLNTPSLKSITFRGSGDIRFLNSLQNAEFELNTWEASGNVHLDLNCKAVELKSHTGPADIYCRGFTQSLVAYTNGLGRLELTNLIAEEVLAVNVNSASLKVHADSILNANIEGSGDILYKGEPKIQLRDNGKGRLLPIY